MPASTTVGNAILNFYLRGVDITPPLRVYVSLHTADPGGAGANEVLVANWPAYVRKDPANGGAIATGFDAAANKATQNALEMLWPANNGAAAVTVTHVGIWDAATGGTFLAGAALLASKTIQVSDECVFHIGDLDVTVT